MDWTEEQRKAIELRNRNILVSAAAGSGKTAVLVERIRRLIIEEKVSVNEILVVTFTNAAASEMREKIVTAISGAISGQSRGDERGGVADSAFLREQLAGIHKANISTFHAFAMDVIKRYFHLIQIEPNFKICDEAQQSILKAQAMEDLFARKFQEEDQAFLRFLSVYGGSRNDNAVKEMILEAHEFVQSLPESFGWLREKTEALEVSEEEFQRTEAFQKLMEQIDRELSFAIFKTEKVGDLLGASNLNGLCKKGEEDLAMLREIRRAFEESFDRGILAVRQAEFSRFTATKEEREAFQEIKDDVAFLRKEAKEALRKIRESYGWGILAEQLEEMRQVAPEAVTLCRLTEEFHEEYRMRKQKKGLLDFSDIEHYALDILKIPEAAKAYQEKFRHIFIDEYQDSNLIQEALIEKIRREDNLFMVGDVKQSIYKFRLAEPRIFIDRYEAFKSAGKFGKDQKLDLNRNFRSKGPIIDAINHVFKQVMNVSTAGMEYGEGAALYKGVTCPADMEFPVSLRLIDDGDTGDELEEEIREMKRAELEAAIAARILTDHLGRPFYDVKQKKIRPLEKKDMVILLRSASGAGQAYIEALHQAGIPAYMDAGDGFFDTMEISVFLNLLKVVDNKKQDIPLLSVLRSPIFDFSVSELAEIRREQRKGSYERAFFAYAQRSGEPLGEKCRDVLERLERWRQWSGFYPLEEFLWKLLLDTDYFHYIAAIPGGSRRQANLRLLMEKAAGYQQSQGKGLFGFINYAEALKKQKVPTPQVRMVSESDDVVRIMTIHKSKGLEFPLVLVGNLGRGFHRNSRGRSISFHKDLGVALPWIDRRKRCYRRTLLKNVIDMQRASEDLAEEIRILYVAMTRAMDRMILLGSLRNFKKTWESAGFKDPGDGKAGSYLDFLLPALQENEGVEVFSYTRADAAEQRREQKQRDNDVQRGLEEGFRLVDQSLLRLVKERLEWRYPYFAAVETKSKFSVSQLRQEALGKDGRGEPQYKIHLASPVFSKEERDFTAAEKGTILHRIMEQIPFTKEGKTMPEIREFVQELVRKEILAEGEAKAVDLEKVAAFFASELGERAVGSQELFREVSFNLKRSRKGEPILVQGTIDCYFKENGSYILLDYKSNYVTETEEALRDVAETYRPQLMLYKEALEKIRGIEISETYLYLFALGRGIKL